MSHTVQIDENDSVRITDADIEACPPDRLAFEVEGTLTLTETLLATFEGATLNPTQVTVTVDESRSIAVDLTDEASLRLESLDVGVAPPDVDDLVPNSDTLSAIADGDTATEVPEPEVLAFTVEGVIRDVPSEVVGAVAAGDPALESLTFAIDTARTDGGAESEVVLELALFGYGIVVRRNGLITIGPRRRHDRDE